MPSHTIAVQNLAGEVVVLEDKIMKSKVAEIRATKRAEELEADASAANKARKASASENIELKTIIANLQVSILSYRLSCLLFLRTSSRPAFLSRNPREKRKKLEHLCISIQASMGLAVC